MANDIAALSSTPPPYSHGVSITYDQELLRDIWYGFSRANRKRIAKFKNNFLAGIYPVNIQSLGLIVSFTCWMFFFGHDITFFVATFFQKYIFYYFFGLGIISKFLAAVFAGSLLWLFLVQLIRLSLRCFLCYKGWLYESSRDGKKISTTTRLWFMALGFFSKSRIMTRSFQGALPRLPLPSLDETLDRYLISVRPFTADKEFNELVDLSAKFREGVGRVLQRYLYVKYLLSANYVNDWWEEYIYLRQRSPIMVNSNYFSFGPLDSFGTTKQAARAANITWAALLFRRLVEHQEVSPFSMNPRTKVPFCMTQYDRMFNSCRIPGEEIDTIRVWDDVKHIAVYSKGSWFKLPIHSGKRLLEPSELQLAFQEILDCKYEPSPHEGKLAVLTAGDRTPWAIARRKYFNSGMNKTSLQAIEQSAFVIIFDEEEHTYDPSDPSKLDNWGASILHGKAYDRWFDKTFNIIISASCRVGVNAEHSWADAAVPAHCIEYVFLNDYRRGYTDTGDCSGKPEVIVHPTRLTWTINQEVQETIKTSLEVARSLISEVDWASLVWTEYGKGFIKKLQISPDAFIQMLIQLTYYKDQRKFSLTYEATMTRLYREGRTETVRSCTTESCNFVRAMLNESATREERLGLLRIAAERHQQLYRAAMSGKGIDRHLFALNIVLRYLKLDSPFMSKIMPPVYLLSTSQTPLNQCDFELKGFKLKENELFKGFSVGGGFGPVTDEGYGVSYIVTGESLLSFHISSKKSAPNTDSKRFRQEIVNSLQSMRELFNS